VAELIPVKSHYILFFA